MAKDLWTPKYRGKVIPNKKKIIPRKRKHDARDMS